MGKNKKNNKNKKRNNSKVILLITAISLILIAALVLILIFTIGNKNKGETAGTTPPQNLPEINEDFHIGEDGGINLPLIDYIPK